jgi:hypothetical protein
MTNVAQNQLIAELARDLVSQVAPQELPLYRVASEAYFKNPAKIQAGQTGQDEMLGFGPGEAAAFLTPVILATLSAVITFLAGEVKKSLKEEAGGLVNEAVKQMFTIFRQKEKESPPSLTPAQLAQVRAIVLKQANVYKLSESRSKLLADAIVGKLAINT